MSVRQRSCSEEEDMRGAIRGAFLAALIPCGVASQATELQEGVRVRGTSLSERFEGILLARKGDTLTIGSRRSTRDLPLVSITNLQIYRGKDRWAGARRGALWGAAVGLLLGVASAKSPGAFYECYNAKPCDPPTSTEAFISAFALSTLSGATIGGYIGTEKWQRVLLTRSIGAR
jgi:hypothetical protein